MKKAGRGAKPWMYLYKHDIPESIEITTCRPKNSHSCSSRTRIAKPMRPGSAKYERFFSNIGKGSQDKINISTHENKVIISTPSEIVSISTDEVKQLKKDLSHYKVDNKRYKANVARYKATIKELRSKVKTLTHSIRKSNKNLSKMENIIYSSMDKFDKTIKKARIIR